MNRPTDILRDEHRVILQALAVLERATDQLAAGAEPPAGWWGNLLDWFRSFADRNHHAKEEAALFPAMTKAGIPSEHGPIAVMLEEHVQGRALIQAMAAGAPAERVASARAYLDLLRAHIDKEDHVLFPLADSVLDEEAVEGLRREFEAVRAEQGRDASADYAEVVIRGLAEALG